MQSILVNVLIKKKNILVEKPAFINLKDLSFLKSELQKEKIFFTEAFMYRYLPYFKKVKEIIERNSLGKIVSSILKVRRSSII